MSKDAFEQYVLPLFEGTRADWLTQARGVALSLGRHQGDVTIDHVRGLCPPPASVDPRVMGAVFKGEEWEKVGYERSVRRECHNRPVAVFRLR